MAAAPYCKTTDSRNKLEDSFQKALRELNKHDDVLFDQYIARKLRAWYTRIPPNLSEAHLRTWWRRLRR